MALKEKKEFSYADALTSMKGSPEGTGRPNNLVSSLGVLNSPVNKKPTTTNNAFGSAGFGQVLGASPNGMLPIGMMNSLGLPQADTSALDALIKQKEDAKNQNLLLNVGGSKPPVTNNDNGITPPASNTGVSGSTSDTGTKPFGLSTEDYYNALNKLSYTPSRFEYKDFDSTPYLQAIQMAKDNITNRKPFAYDINADALYQQYKNQYMQQGNLAMQDAIAQASAMTGGYGNSYAAQVGNQAYQQSLSQLNNVIPELYGLAYDKYNNETNELYNQYGLATDDYDRALNEYGVGYNKALKEYEKDEDTKYNAYTMALDKLKTQYGLSNASGTTSSGGTSLGTSSSSGSSSLGSTVIKPTQTENTEAFVRNLLTKDKFSGHNTVNGKTFNTYKDYVEDTLNRWLEQKQLTDDEAAWIYANLILGN